MQYICECGKSFEVVSVEGWAYKDEGKLFHTYSCLLKHRRSKVPVFPDYSLSAAQRRILRDKEIIRKRSKGASINTLASQFNLSRSAVKNICRKVK